jgi:[acyl-carrier-protein] S-malonyltransferase
MKTNHTPFRYADEPKPLAYLCPGQGSQHTGMLQELAAAYPAVRQTLEEADDVLGFALSKLCFEGPGDELTNTINAQPALLTASVAALRALQSELGVLPRPILFAGHSLGEYSALVAANSIEFADGLRLVRERGRLMAEAGNEAAGRMAAILGLDEEKVAEICAHIRAETGAVVQIANDNCPGQLVISGDEQGMEQAMAALQAAGARRVVPLEVSIAAHSPLMAPVAEELRSAIEATPIQSPTAPLIANTTTDFLTAPQAIRAELTSQLTGSVLWTGSMQRALAEGVTIFVEIGPGDVLAGLMKRIDRGSERFSVADPAGVTAFVQRIQTAAL